MVFTRSIRSDWRLIGLKRWGDHRSTARRWGINRGWFGCTRETGSTGRWTSVRGFASRGLWKMRTCRIRRACGLRLWRTSIGLPRLCQRIRNRLMTCLRDWHQRGGNGTARCEPLRTDLRGAATPTTLTRPNLAQHGVPGQCRLHCCPGARGCRPAWRCIVCRPPCSSWEKRLGCH